MYKIRNQIERYHNIMDNLLRDKNKVLEILDGIKTIHMKETSQKGNLMDKVLLNLKEKFMLEYGQMEHK